MGLLSEIAYESMDNKKLHYKANSTLTDETSWLITLSSVLSAFNGDYVNAVESGKDAEEIAEGVSNMWNIRDRESFLQVHSWLVTEGQRQEYQGKLEFVQFLHHETFEKGFPIVKAFGGNALFTLVNMRIFFTNRDKLKQFAGQLGVKDTDLNALLPVYQAWLEALDKANLGSVNEVRSLLAWDAVRLVNVCRWSLQLGYLQESEFLTYAGRLTEQVKQTYASWDDVILAYAVGGFIWNNEELRVKHLLRTLKMLKKDPESPIHKVAFR